MADGLGCHYPRQGLCPSIFLCSEESERADMGFSELGCRPNMGLDSYGFWRQVRHCGNAQEDYCCIVALSVSCDQGSEFGTKTFVVSNVS